MRRRLLVSLVALLATAAPLAAAGPAAAVAPPYTLTAGTAGELLVRPALGGSTINVQMTGLGLGGLRLQPAATGLLPAGCAPGGVPDATDCLASRVGTRIDVDAPVLEATAIGVQTGNLRLNGGPDTDRLTVLGSIIGVLGLTTDRGADEVTVTGTIGSITDVVGTDTSDDRYTFVTPGATGTIAPAGGDDLIDATGSTLTLSGGEGNDSLTGMGLLQGDGGNDLLRPRTTTQRVEGGPGIDRVSYDGPSSGLTATGLTLTLATHDDVRVNAATTASLIDVEDVEGSDGPDTLVGIDPGADPNDGADVLRGGLGDDTLRGRGGTDQLDGGPGQDTVTWDELPAGTPVVIDFAAGRGGPANVDAAQRDALTAVERGVGTAGDDVAVGGGGAERFTMQGGTDVVLAGGGDDHIDTGSGAATVDAGPGDDTVTTDLTAGGNDTVSGGDGADTIKTGPGDDMLRGNAGADTLEGGSGRDAVTYDERSAPVSVALDGVANDGASGESDVLDSIEDVIGGSGDDTLTGDDGQNRLTGGEGADTLVGLGGPDELSGGGGRDIVAGGAGNDTMAGDADNDRLLAFDGFADVVECGDGNDDEAEQDGLDRVGGCEFSRRLDITGPADRDGDGVVEGIDCDDRNPDIRPGAADVAGNGLDEDCSGADRPLPILEAPLRTSFSVLRSGTMIGRLTATRLPAGTRVTVSCRATVRFRRRCPFTTRTVGPRAGSREVQLASLFRRRRLPVGTKVEIHIKAEGYIGRAVRLTMRRTALPRGEQLCLAPGARSPSRCPEED